MSTIDSVITANEELQAAIESFNTSRPMNFGAMSLALEEAQSDNTAEKKTTMVEKVKAFFKKIWEWFTNLFSKKKSKDQQEETKSDYFEKAKKMEEKFDEMAEVLNKAFFGDEAVAKDAPQAAQTTQAAAKPAAQTTSTFGGNKRKAGDDIGDEIITHIRNSAQFATTIRSAVSATPELYPYLFANGSLSYESYVRLAEQTQAQLLKYFDQLVSHISKPGEQSSAQAISTLSAEVQKYIESNVLLASANRAEAITKLAASTDHIKMAWEISNLMNRRPNCMYPSQATDHINKVMNTLNNVSFGNVPDDVASKFATDATACCQKIIVAFGKVISLANDSYDVQLKYIHAFNRIANADGHAEKVVQEFTAKYPDIVGMKETVLFSYGVAHMRTMNGKGA